MKRKMLNRKGFTLVELLAVIVILAVLLLMVLPRALETMENARQGIFENEVKTFIRQAEQKYAEKSIEKTEYSMCFTSGGSDEDSFGTIDVDVKKGYEYAIYVEFNPSEKVLRYSFDIKNGSNYLASGHKILRTENFELKAADNAGTVALTSCADLAKRTTKST